MRGASVGLGLAAILGCAHAQKPPPPPAGDSCLDAATAMSEQCCEGTEAYACTTTTRSLAEMCGLAECTAALEAADGACAAVPDSPSAQAFSSMRGLLSCAGLEDPCVGTVQTTMTATCGLDPMLMYAGVDALTAASTTVCANEACLREMHTRVEECSTAADFGTLLTVQMFSQLAELCEGGGGGRCTPEQMEELHAACGRPEAPTCDTCMPKLTELLPMCPVTFADPEQTAVAMACGNEAQTAMNSPCPPGSIEGLKRAACPASFPCEAPDCEAFAASYQELAQPYPCVELSTDLDIANMAVTCAGAVAAAQLGPAAGGEGGGAEGASVLDTLLAQLGQSGALETLNGLACAATEDQLHSACCPGGDWPCDSPVCGDPIDLTQCLGITLSCPALLVGKPEQEVSQSCLAQVSSSICTPEAVERMHTACCPSGWPCGDLPGHLSPSHSGSKKPKPVRPTCNEECVGELREMSSVCPVTMAGDAELLPMLSQCQQIEEAAAGAGVNINGECDQGHIDAMHRACCPTGWPASIDDGSCSRPICGTGPAECLGLMQTTSTDCPTLLLDPVTANVVTTCSTSAGFDVARVAGIVPTDGGSDGGGIPAGGRGGGGRTSSRSRSPPPPPPPPPPPTGDSGGDASDDDSPASTIILVAGVVAILGVGGLVVQRKSKPQASVDFGGDSMYDQQGFGASPGLPS